MNMRLFLTFFLTLMLVAGTGSLMAAEEQPAAPATPPAGGEHSGHQAEAAPPAAPSDHAQPGEPGMMGCPSMDQMHQQRQEVTGLVSQLRTEMEVIKKTAVPETRKKLIQDHLATMSKALQLLKDSACSQMMQEGKCPMMGGMQQEPGKEGDTAQQGMMGQGGMMGHHGMMGKEHGQMMSMCHRMMANREELNHSLLEQLLELQVLQWGESK